MDEFCWIKSVSSTTYLRRTTSLVLIVKIKSR